MELIQKRVWAEISLAHLAHNYRAVRTGLRRGCRVMAVVKADAYGHGAPAVALHLQALGAEYMGVASLDEAVALREAGVIVPILIFGYTAPEFSGTLLRYGLTQTVFDLACAKALAQAATAAGGKINVHVKVDTGMSRLGFVGPQAIAEILEVYALRGLSCEGIFTHFADADGSEDSALVQLAEFQAMVSHLADSGAAFSIRHCANSAAALRWPETHLDMVRIGLALYGYDPIRDISTANLCPVMTLKTRVCAVRHLPAGATISYGRTHTLERDSVVATLSIGYADGLLRLLSGKAQVRIAGQNVPILGRICMDFCMADVTDLPPVAVGDEVVVFGPELSAQEKADAMGTIPYELLCAVSARVPREIVRG